MTDAFVVLRTYLDAFPADADRALLESHGLEARLDGSHVASVLPLHTIATGGVRLLVRDTDRAKADAILTDARDAEDDASDDDDEEDAESDAVIGARMEVDGDLRRAAAVAMFGFFMCVGVGAAYSAYLLAQTNDAIASSRGRTMATIAKVFIALELVKVVAFLALFRS